MIDPILDLSICPECKKTYLNCICGRYKVNINKDAILANQNLNDNVVFEVEDKAIVIGFDLQDCKFNIYTHYDKWASMLCVSNYGEINLTLSIDEFNKLNPLLKDVYISALNQNLRYITLIDLKEL